VAYKVRKGHPSHIFLTASLLELAIDSRRLGLGFFLFRLAAPAAIQGYRECRAPVPPSLVSPRGLSGAMGGIRSLLLPCRPRLYAWAPSRVRDGDSACSTKVREGSRALETSHWSLPLSVLQISGRSA
jgi:hypothetical protein